MSDNDNSEKPIMQKCMACNQSFNALLYSCPHCGTGGESVMAGGMEMIEIMVKKQGAASLNDKGVQLYQQGKVNEAVSLLQKSIEVNPMHEKAYENLAYVLIQRGRFEEARGILQKVLTINPRREDARRYMAEVKSTLDRAAAKPPSPAMAAGSQKPARKWYQFWQ